MSIIADERTDELRAVVERMERLLGPKAGPDVPDYVAPGDMIESRWGNAMVNGCVHVYPTYQTLIDQWTNPPDGAIAQAPTGVFWIARGGTWDTTDSKVGKHWVDTRNVPTLVNDIIFYDPFGVWPVPTLSRFSVDSMYVKWSPAPEMFNVFTEIFSGTDPNGITGWRKYGLGYTYMNTPGQMQVLPGTLLGEQIVPAFAPAPVWTLRLRGYYFQGTSQSGQQATDCNLSLWRHPMPPLD